MTATRLIREACHPYPSPPAAAILGHSADEAGQGTWLNRVLGGLDREELAQLATALYARDPVGFEQSLLWIGESRQQHEGRIRS